MSNEIFLFLAITFHIITGLIAARILAKKYDGVTFLELFILTFFGIYSFLAVVVDVVIDPPNTSEERKIWRNK